MSGLPPAVQSRIEMLKYLPRKSLGAEIGVHRGDFSVELVRHVQPKVLWLIDPWSESTVTALGRTYWTRRARETWQIKLWIDESCNGSEAMRDVIARFGCRIASGSVRLIRRKSVRALADFPENSLDWIYIDGDHSFNGAYRDLLMARRVVKPGGAIMGHDYDPALPGVVDAVDRFCGRNSLKIDCLSDELPIPLPPSGSGLTSARFLSFWIINHK